MDNPLRWLALVLLDEPQLPEFDDVARWVGENFADAPDMTVAGSTDNMFSCTLGNSTAAATLVDRTVPWSQLEGPCATAWYWPDAADSLRDHTAHIMLTLVDEGGNAIEKSQRLTQLVAGVAATTRAHGIFWGPGRLVHPVGAFIEQAVPSTAEDLPLFLWIDFRVERTETGNVQLYTTGLEALGQPEMESLEFPGEPQHLLEFAYNLAHYQLCQSKTINDGDTIGLTEEIQVVARRQGSMFDESLEVLKLEFQTAGG